MQNTVLLAMLKSHRIVKNGKKYSVMSFNDYTMMKEIETLKTIVSKNADLKKLYDTYIRNVKKDLNKIKQFDTFTEDVNRNFLRAYCSKEIIDNYIKQRDEILKEAKNEFKLNPTLESQYMLKDGIAVLADSTLISEEDTGRFKEKVQSELRKKVSINFLKTKYRLSPSTLKRWGVECGMGNSITKIISTEELNALKEKHKGTKNPEIKELLEQLEYAKMENDILKKLGTLVQARKEKEQQQSKN
jgi:hypothetical protein